MLIVPAGTCASDAEALAVVVVGGVGVGVLPALGVDVGVVAVVAVVAALVGVGDGVAVGGPPGVGVGASGVAIGLLMVTVGVCAAMCDANDWEGAAPATGVTSSASNVTPSARPRETIRLADTAAVGCLRPLIPDPPPHLSSGNRAWGRYNCSYSVP